MVGRYFNVAALMFAVGCGDNLTSGDQSPSTEPQPGTVTDDPGVGAGSGDTVTPPTGGGDTVTPPAGGGDTVTPPGGGSGATPGTPAASCPIGAASFEIALGLAGNDQASSLAIDSEGSVYVATTAAAGSSAGAASGVTKLSASGEILFKKPFGSVVATDKAGHAFIAGSFTSSLDLGGGVVLEPQGNVDVFVAELDSAGNVIFARALGLCGDSVLSIAVDATGRIAVSGSAMGTVVLSATGDVVFSVAAVGSLAFDSKGDLVIAGNLITATDLGTGMVDGVQPAAGDGFVLEVDASGNTVFARLVDGGSVHVKGVAVDSKDSVVFTGFTDNTVDLFGDKFTVHTTPEGLRFGGGFIAKLDTTGAVVWKDGVGLTEQNAIAVDASDNVIFAGADTGNAGFNRINDVVKLDSTGADVSASDMFTATGYGRGESVAADACGSIYVTTNTVATFSPRITDLYVVKLAK